MKAIIPVLLVISTALSCGCTQSREHAASPTLPEGPSLRILSEVLREMGKRYPSHTMYWLDVSDSEFAWLQRDFQLHPPGFRFTRLRGQKAASDAEILKVFDIKRKANRATANLIYRTGNQFAEYLFILKRDNEAWRVTDCKFTYGS